MGNERHFQIFNAKWLSQQRTSLANDVILKSQAMFKSGFLPGQGLLLIRVMLYSCSKAACLNLRHSFYKNHNTDTKSHISIASSVKQFVCRSNVNSHNHSDKNIRNRIAKRQSKRCLDYSALGLRQLSSYKSSWICPHQAQT